MKKFEPRARCVLWIMAAVLASSTLGASPSLRGTDGWSEARDAFRLAVAQKDNEAALDALENFTIYDSKELAVLLIDVGLNHADMEIYRESERHLRRLEDKFAQEAVIEAAKKQKSWHLRADCTRILSNFHNQLSFDALIELLSDKNWLVRSEAIRGLSMIRERKTVRILIERMPKESGRILDDIGEALKTLTLQDIPPDARRWQSWWDAFGKEMDLPDEDATAAAEPTKKRLGTAVKEGLYGSVISERVAFLIDVSGSMTAGTELEGNRHQIATKELIRVLENQIGPDAEFNVIAFAEEIVPFSPKLQKGKGSKIKNAIKFVKALQPGGETNAFGALETAFRDPKVDTIYLLSDGSPTVGEETIPALIRRQVLEWNRYRGVKIHCIGFFPGEARYQDKTEARTFLINLSHENRGRYTEID